MVPASSVSHMPDFLNCLVHNVRMCICASVLRLSISYVYGKSFEVEKFCTFPGSINNHETFPVSQHNRVSPRKTTIQSSIFSSKLQLVSTIVKLFHLEQFAIYVW